MKPVKTATLTIAVVPKPSYLSAAILQAARNHDHDLPHHDPSSCVYLHLEVLAKFSVVGFSIRHQMNCVREFLHFHRVVHSTNERGVLWLPEASDGIRALLGA